MFSLTFFILIALCRMRWMWWILQLTSKQISGNTSVVYAKDFQIKFFVYLLSANTQHW